MPKPSDINDMISKTDVNSKSSVALIIIYNHKYVKNIDILEKLYERRFSNIFHLMPFYNGNKKNVISVYENSYYFQGYIAQGFSIFSDKKIDHYFFVADDLFLNPNINENNYEDWFQIKSSDSFLPEFFALHNDNKYWRCNAFACNYMRKNLRGLEVPNELPKYREAYERLSRHGIKVKPLKTIHICQRGHRLNTTVLTPTYKKILPYFYYEFKYFYNKIANFLLGKHHLQLKYPLVGSYSDILIVSQNSIKKFAHYCGVFAAQRLFVELAIPTALLLSSESIVTEKATKHKGKPLWTDHDYNVLNKYNKNLNKLLIDFLEDCLYIHPIKLSQWDTSNLQL